MKKETSEQSTQNISDLQKGQEFLDRFKKLSYNRDRLGQSFIAKSNKR
jgi:hypothetical protein